jgi:hypothetical protein
MEECKPLAVGLTTAIGLKESLDSSIFALCLAGPRHAPLLPSHLAQSVLPVYPYLTNSPHPSL